jgi:hypothetical protein
MLGYPLQQAEAPGAWVPPRLPLPLNLTHVWRVASDMFTFPAYCCPVSDCFALFPGKRLSVAPTFLD